MKIGVTLILLLISSVTFVNSWNNPHVFLQMKIQSESQEISQKQGLIQMFEQTKPDNVNDQSWNVFKDINDFRTQNQKSELLWDDLLYQLCQDHNKESINAGHLSHNNFWKRCSQIPDAKRCGENVGAVYQIVNPEKEIEKAWENSMEHRNNLLSDTEYSAVSAVYSSQEDAWYYCQFFVGFE